MLFRSMFCSIWIKHLFWERRKGSSFGNVGEWKSRAETEERNSDSSLLTNRDGEQKGVSMECWFILDSDILLSATLKNPLTPGLSMLWYQPKDHLCSDISPRIDLCWDISPRIIYAVAMGSQKIWSSCFLNFRTTVEDSRGSVGHILNRCSSLQGSLTRGQALCLPGTWWTALSFLRMVGWSQRSQAVGLEMKAVFDGMDYFLPGAKLVRASFSLGEVTSEIRGGGCSAACASEWLKRSVLMRIDSEVCWVLSLSFWNLHVIKHIKPILYSGRYSQAKA